MLQAHLAGDEVETVIQTTCASPSFRPNRSGDVEAMCFGCVMSNDPLFIAAYSTAPIPARGNQVRWGHDRERVRAATLSDTIPAPSIDALLAERGSTHGEFGEHSAVSQTSRRSCVPSRVEAAHASAARKPGDAGAQDFTVLAGDPHRPDHWADIQGYARLVEKWL